ncbi:TPA: hypothetical protein N0F65_001176 [Lagenidium giganteum]|uniref:PX domain-containing protein n=1 Tax=Lagenidium giganteum TaxID=4803 RepID=A0AAV2Z4I2_9STRA|nr:TPA: hypothetical protein N0F65_001176 [Lagenidium giganteum]
MDTPPLLQQRFSWHPASADVAQLLGSPTHDKPSRFSMPQLDRLSVSAPTGDSALSHTHVRFVGVTKRVDHCIYVVHVDTGMEQFVINKRYSDFRSFRARVLAMQQAYTQCSGPCRHLSQLTQVKFPRRKFQFSKQPNLELARDRSFYLQRFLQALLRIYRTAPRRQARCCVNSQCPLLALIVNFLNITTTQVPEPTVSKEEPVLPSSDARRQQMRDFPPPTRVSIQLEGVHQFYRLYPITEDTEMHPI